MLRFLNAEQIDKNRWEASLNAAPGGFLYQHADWLDIFAPGWEALVNEDYSFCWPLPKKRKWGLPFALQPLFSQHLGWFGSDLTELPAAWQLVKRRYVMARLNWKETIPGGPQATPHRNRILDLNSAYEHIREAYSSNHRRNLKKAAALYQLRDSDEITLMEVLDTIRLFNPDHHAFEEPWLSRIYQALNGPFAANTFWRAGVNESGDIDAAAIFLQFKNRLIYLAGASTEEGKNRGAMHFIMDEWIRQWAAQPFYMDFEGSDLEGVDRFFSGFGATEEWYYGVKFNLLGI